VCFFCERDNNNKDEYNINYNKNKYIFYDNDK